MKDAEAIGVELWRLRGNVEDVTADRRRLRNLIVSHNDRMDYECNCRRVRGSCFVVPGQPSCGDCPQHYSIDINAGKPEVGNAKHF